MKRILIPATLCMAAGSFAFAQQPQASPDQQPAAPITRPHEHHGPHAHNPQREAERLSRRLSLSPDQTAKIEPIFADREQKIAALQVNTSLSMEEMHQQMHAIHQQERTQLDAVLTPEQQEQLKSMHHGHRGHGEQPGAPAGA